MEGVSIRERILQRIAEALGASGGPPGLTVHRYPELPLEDDSLPALAVYPTPATSGRETCDRDDHDGAVRRALPVSIESRVVTTVAGPPVATLLDPLTTWAIRVVTTDPVLAALVEDVQEDGTAWESYTGSRIYGAARQDLVITYITRENNPEEP